MLNLLLTCVESVPYLGTKFSIRYLKGYFMQIISVLKKRLFNFNIILLLYVIITVDKI